MLASHSTQANSELEQTWMGATNAGDVSALQSLLSANPLLLNTRVHHQTFEKSTALHLATWKGHLETVEFLLNQGADIETQDQTGMTALQIDVMRICLQKMRPTAFLRSRCIDIQSPVALAISKRRQTRDRSSYRDIDTSVLDLLLYHNANVNRSNEAGDTTLLNAVEYGLISHVEKLLAHGADAHAQDMNGRSAMDIAGEHGFVDIVNVLAEKCPDLITTVGDKTLVMAVRHEFSGILEALYDRVLSTLGHVDGEEDYFSPKFVAVKMLENLEVMEVLIRDNAKFDFPTRQSRDSVGTNMHLVAALLLYAGNLTPTEVTKLLVDIASSSCIRHKLRFVILSLAWQEHTYEALLLTFIVLFSPQASDVEQALTVFKSWMLRFEANLVALKLLTDALSL
ncbi:hypothetical protein BBJ29_001077 [Phytophthora kernoviae]|uniref:Uncharacterized protein n=1 Tax=Phytophthora kernoviae TaxID=325452 RepID=A0A3F2RZV2_9STRA|nr:hypothetical protein BBJ29_001077 [Phytophthora kernoviae]RLN67542.1 hypothetical protein BBP00_00001547 [Phytophthora kernoviae]